MGNTVNAAVFEGRANVRGTSCPFGTLVPMILPYADMVFGSQETGRACSHSGEAGSRLVTPVHHAVVIRIEAHSIDIQDISLLQF